MRFQPKIEDEKIRDIMDKRSRVIVILFLTAFLGSGCAGRPNLTTFESRKPFQPDIGEELLWELKSGLSEEVQIHYFLFKQKKECMRGSVLLRGKRDMNEVREMIRGNPSLRHVITEPANKGKYLIAFCSIGDFHPKSVAELMDKFQKDLPQKVKVKLIAAKQKEKSTVAWVLVKGVFNKEVIKYTLRENPNLSSAEVEKADPITIIMLKTKHSNLR